MLQTWRGNFLIKLDWDIQILSLKTTCRAQRWQFDLPGECINDNSNSTCHFYFTFCKSLPDSGDCTGSSICQYSNNLEGVFELGHYDNDDPFIGNEVNGFYALFNRVKPIINKFTNQPCNLSVRIEFDCDKNAPWPVQDDISQAPLPLNYTSYTKDSCEVNLNNKSLKNLV